MDAAGYLKRHGWRGDGYSLDLTGRGIRKPLLVSKKVDVLGVGLNKHAAVSDQWWMRAFDQGLQNLGTGKESTLVSVRKHGVHHGGLYGRFVRGESVPGTIGTKGWSSLTSPPEPFTTSAHNGDEAQANGLQGQRKQKVAESLQESDLDQLNRVQSAGRKRKHAGASGSAVESANDANESSAAFARRLRKKRLSSAKRAEYEKRAASKNMTVEDYIKRREQKYTAKKRFKSKRPP